MLLFYGSWTSKDDRKRCCSCFLDSDGTLEPLSAIMIDSAVLKFNVQYIAAHGKCLDQWCAWKPVIIIIDHVTFFWAFAFFPVQLNLRSCSTLLQRSWTFAAFLRSTLAWWLLSTHYTVVLHAQDIHCTVWLHFGVHACFDISIKFRSSATLLHRHGA